MDQLPATLALLKPDDLWPAWRMVDALEQAGEMDPDEAGRAGLLHCGYDRVK